MKYLGIIIAVVALFVGSHLYTAWLENSDIDLDLDVQTIRTDKGYDIWMIEDHYLPIVSVNLTFKNSGFAYDPKGKSGLATLVASLIDEGSGDLSSFEYRKKLEELATTVSYSADEDFFNVTIKTLKQNLPQALQVVNNALTAPHFEEETISRIKKQIKVVINKKNEDPSYVAAVAFKQAIFGSHPYSNLKYGNESGLDNISRDDLVRYVKDHFTNANVAISIAGDVKAKNISSLIDAKIFLPPAGRLLEDISTVKFDYKPEVKYIERNIPQSVIIFGGKGVKRNDENFYAAYVMNYILGGGGFESRLMDEVREKRGLAYSTYSYLELLKKCGIFVGYAGTKASSTEEAMQVIKEQLALIAEKGVSREELDDAKNYLVNSFPLKMTKNENLAAFLSVMQTNDLGQDFLNKRNSYVNSVTADAIQNLAKSIVSPEKMIFIVVGKQK